MKKYLTYIFIILSCSVVHAQEINYTFSPINGAECSYMPNITNSISNNFNQTQQIIRPKIRDTSGSTYIDIPTKLPIPNGEYYLEQDHITKSGIYYYNIQPPYSKTAIVDSFFVKIIGDEKEDEEYVTNEITIVNLVNASYPYIVIRNIGDFSDIELKIYDVSGIMLHQNDAYDNTYSTSNLRRGTYFYILRTKNNIGKKIKQKGFVEKI